MLTESERELIAKVKAAEASIPKGEWYCEIDGWPVRITPGEESKGVLPYYAASINNSDDNPYRPYEVSFETLSFICTARNSIPSLLAIIERLYKNYGASIRLLRMIARRLDGYCEEREVLDFLADRNKPTNQKD